jgi:hypothetical protein
VIASVLEKFQHLFKLAKYCKFVTQKNFSAAHTKDSGEKKSAKVTIFIQQIPAGCQNIAGFLNFSTFLSDL